MSAFQRARATSRFLLLKFGIRKMADEQSRTVAVLERVFLRLTLADDSKLTDILKRILPMLLGLFKPGQQVYPQCYLTVETTSFIFVLLLD